MEESHTCRKLDGLDEVEDGEVENNGEKEEPRRRRVDGEEPKYPAGCRYAWAARWNLLASAHQELSRDGLPAGFVCQWRCAHRVALVLQEGVGDLSTVQGRVRGFTSVAIH